VLCRPEIDNAFKKAEIIIPAKDGSRLYSGEGLGWFEVPPETFF